MAVTALMLVGAINPANAYLGGTVHGSVEGMDEIYNSENFLISDDGYIFKANPQTEFADRSTMTGKLIHEVEAGDTISTIAAEYGIKTNTVLWENGISANSTLKIGQKLIIPPVDGISHTVAKGEDVKKIATLYGVQSDDIIRQNQLGENAVIGIGQELFIPGAKPLPVRVDPARIESSSRIGTAGSTKIVAGSVIGANSDAVPVGGKFMIKPTNGAVTQNFHSGHYAYDIADRSKPPIWAAADGTVIKASSGTWGGGYGNHIIIDHGNGVQTLYAHMEYLSVNVGDHVSQGQVIGKMGNTGNVRGITGIHLHFEVIVNGKKQVPSNYY